MLIKLRFIIYMIIILVLKFLKMSQIFIITLLFLLIKEELLQENILLYVK